MNGIKGIREIDGEWMLGFVTWKHINNPLPTIFYDSRSLNNTCSCMTAFVIGEMRLYLHVDKREEGFQLHLGFLGKG